jgi:hypothetical protein
MHDRVTAVLQGHTPDRLPFIDRMELWYESRRQDEKYPETYTGMSLNDIHKAVGMGRQGSFEV